MINKEEFDRVCRLGQLMEIKGAWATPDKKEIIELKQDKIVNSYFVDGERIYGKPALDSKIIAVMGAFAVPDEPKKEEPASTPDTKQDNSSVISVIMPTQFTDELLSKWANLSTAQRLILVSKTAQNEIKTRKGRGGNVRYVDIDYMLRCANMSFAFQWDSVVTDWKQTETEIICFGSVQALINEKRIIKSAVGQKDIAFLKDQPGKPVCLGDDYKASQSDMIKKALSQFGIASDVYGGDV